MSCNNNTSNCPHCGGEINADAVCCPHCGSDEETGWSSETYLDGVGLSDDVSYEEVRRNEFGNGISRNGLTRHRVLFIAVAAILIAALFTGMFLALR